MHYSKSELEALGIKVGRNVLIHKSVLFFGDNIQIGSNVRIDCHSVITSSKQVLIGNNVHLGIGVCLLGTAGIVIEDFSGISAKCSLFTTSDDYSDGNLTNPTLPDEYRKVKSLPIILERHSLIGASSVVMPGVTIHKGGAVGALSFVNKSIPPFVIAAGNPIRKIGVRNREKLEKLEETYDNERIHN
jgi:acetyltransferase-like isoleucine patch superfamily enzyme